MAEIDYAARLEKVQSAIDALLTGGMARYEIEGQSVTLLDLDALQREEQRLIARIRRQSRRGRAFSTLAVRR